MADKICHLCGTHYTDKKGHPLNDCWGIMHQAMLKADATVRYLQYKMSQVQKRIHELKENNGLSIPKNNTSR